MIPRVGRRANILLFTLKAELIVLYILIGSVQSTARDKFVFGVTLFLTITLIALLTPINLYTRFINNLLDNYYKVKANKYL